MTDVREQVEAARMRLRAAAESDDIVHRMVESARIAREAKAAADSARVIRDQAATALHTVHGWKRVKVYKGILGTPRGLYEHIIQRTLPRGIPASFRRSEKVAEATARQYAGVPELWDALAREARDVRNPAIQSLRSGKGGQLLTNARVSELADLTTARVAQLRPQDTVDPSHVVTMTG